ncbi:MAG TPA: SHOCT domain-containing protein [Solirubrobacteraceae bacterium]|nr:SHOCT domain-containing protein [Solirubrobacteraceae bacterium]
MEHEEQTQASGPKQADAGGSPPATTRGRRILIRVLLVLATVLVAFGALAVWANRQVLNANNWADTSSQLLQNDAIKTQVADFMVDQVYANVNVAGELQSALPPRLQPLAGPVAGGLRTVAQKAAFEFLGRPRVQEAWQNAMRLTAQQFINIVENKSNAITLNGNAVYIDLRPLMGQLTTQLGLPASVAQALPAGAGRLKIMSSNQISTVQNSVKLVKGLTIILPAVALLLFALCVYLYTGRRRHALFVVGIDLVIAGLVVLIARNVAGNQIVNALASTEAARPAADGAWTIGTRLLSDIGQSIIIVGLAVMLASSLAGNTRPAVAFRRAAAPWFRLRPFTTYGVVIAIILLIVLWGPIPATRKPIPVLILLVLSWLGVEALRRQTAEEFPDAQFGDAMSGMRARVANWRMRRHGRGAPPPAAPPMAGGAGPPILWSQDERLSRLERLTALRDAGALTEAEFASEKAIVMSMREK